MTDHLKLKPPPNFIRSILILLSAAGRRGIGRIKRQHQLMQMRSGSKRKNLSFLGIFFVIIGVCLLNVLAANVVRVAVNTAQIIELEHEGNMVVTKKFIDALRNEEASLNENEKTSENNLSYDYTLEARKRTKYFGGSEDEQEKYLRKYVYPFSQVKLVEKESTDKIWTLGAQPSHRIAKTLGSLVLLWWFVMMLFQGEGLEFDFMRRRHPMWEWLFIHPVSRSAVFISEMLSPIVANPFYLTAPVFFGVLYAFIYGILWGIAAGVLVGIPLTVGVASLGRALEISSMLRFSLARRTAFLGMMNLMGTATLISFYIIALKMRTIFGLLVPYLRPLSSSYSLPWLGWFTGAQSDGSFAILSGLCFSWLASTLMISLAILISMWGARRGLVGAGFSTKQGPATKKVFVSTHFAKNPLYRKELLWFLRDKSVAIQFILLPLALAGFQLYNFYNLLQVDEITWRHYSGAAIIFGAYFLWTLGPKSLVLEGPALLLAHTWPLGLEELLRAKAKLWFFIATGAVILILSYSLFLYPHDAWKIFLVGLGWAAFGWSMALKSVTLVPPISASGEIEPIPRMQRWAASLGMFTFASGIITQQWQVAVIGIVFSWMTAAAMWQNFRARLPFLFDPWSEKLPPPPTLMHAMIAISVMIELTAVLLVIFVTIAPQFQWLDATMVVRLVAYTISATIVCIATATILANQSLSMRDIWCWDDNQNSLPQFGIAWTRWSGDANRWRRLVVYMALGALGGMILGLAANNYVTYLLRFKTFADMIYETREVMNNFPTVKFSYAIMAIAVAPFAEEYLFRGLLFRALDHEWGGLRAILANGAFFAIYHPPMAWLPAGILGVVNALLFKKTGRLAPAVALHMVYNAVVIFM